MKMHNKIIYVLIAIFFIPQVCFADVFNSPKSLEYIVQKMPVFSNVDCNFKQEKKMPNNVVLNSSGEFLYDKTNGVTFKTTYPIRAINAYSPKEYNQINEIINAIANRRYSKLENQFNFYYLDTNPWQFALKPKTNSQASKYLKYIEISGSKRISKMIVATTNSVKTTIWFYEKD